MSKTILYLDQNFASNLAKAENLPDWKDSDRKFYQELLELLRRRIIDGRLVCPTAPFHREESERGTRVKDFIWHVVEELSFGLSFRDFREINFDQIATAARAYCKMPEPDVPSWSIAFNRDPQKAIRSFRKSPRVLVHISSAKELVEYGRKTTNLVADMYCKFKQARLGESRTYQEELQFQKAVFVYEIFVTPLQIANTELVNIGPPELDRLSNYFGVADLIQFYGSILDILEQSNNARGFFVSDELMETPFVHIRASLMAADIHFCPDKEPSPSLNTDFDIIASVLPYVDILATDGYMAELIRKAKLLDRFKARVFPMRQRRGLMETVRNP